jgi:hypothetical protein
MVAGLKWDPSASRAGKHDTVDKQQKNHGYVCEQFNSEYHRMGSGYYTDRIVAYASHYASHKLTL